MRLIPPVILIAPLALSACLPSPTGPADPSQLTTVVFTYAAPTVTDSIVAETYSQCVTGVGVTHLHPEWRGFQAFSMTAIESDLWALTFVDVPVGSEQRIRVSDPNTCALNPTGASTVGVSANGTLLTRVVDTPGSGIEPGLAFTASTDGNIDP